MKKQTEKFNFWKGNKISCHFQLTKKELVEKFQAWLHTKDIDWLEYYTIGEIVPEFLTDGLESMGNSENDFAEYRVMEEILNPVRREFLDTKTNKKLAS